VNCGTESTVFPHTSSMMVAAKRLRPVILLAILLCNMPGSVVTSTPPRRPNVLFILIDDLVSTLYCGCGMAVLPRTLRTTTSH